MRSSFLDSVNFVYRFNKEISKRPSERVVEWKKTISGEKATAELELLRKPIRKRRKFVGSTTDFREPAQFVEVPIIQPAVITGAVASIETS